MRKWPPPHRSISIHPAPSLQAQAREALLVAPVAAPIAEAIVEAYNRLGSRTPVAVRSSATAEDLPHASFAGQQDTYLHVIGAEAVLQAVRRCWASLWTDRAVVYRNTNGIDHRSVRLAVVIQRMVDSEVAGVLFTANPVTGRRREAVIDASPGLGEAVVSGSVNPDHFVVDTGAGEIVERRLGDKRVEVRSLPGGGTFRYERNTSAGWACVTDDQVRSLAALGDRVEAHFGAPQDIEWAIDADGAIWLTQSRPITTLFPLPAGAGTPDLRVYFCFSVAQGLYRPITPMGLAAFRLLGSAAARMLGTRVDDPLAGPAAFAEAGQRVFIDLTEHAQRPRRPRGDTPHVRRHGSPLGGSPPVFVRRPTIADEATLLAAIRATGAADPDPARDSAADLQALARPEAARARLERIGAELASRLTSPDNVNASERLDFVERVLSTEVIALGPTMFPIAAAGFAMLGFAGKLLGEDAKPDDLQKVLRGLPHNITTEMDLALWTLACSIREDETAARMLREEPLAELARKFHGGGLPPCVQCGLAGFLSRYGHRAVAEIDLGMPRWSDDPTHILGVLSNYLRLDNQESAPDGLFARGAAEAEAMIETLVARAERRGLWRGRLVRLALSRARQLAGLRELPKFYMVFALAAARRELAKIGARIGPAREHRSGGRCVLPRVCRGAGGSRGPRCSRPRRGEAPNISSGNAPPARAARVALRRYRA